LLAFTISLAALGAGANDGDGSYFLYDGEDSNVTYGPFWTADWNETENITGELVLGKLDPYYGNEPFYIGVLWPVFNLTEHPNRTAVARVGLDEATGPQDIIMVYRYEDLYGQSDIQRLWFARSYVFPETSNGVLVATMDTGEGPLSMSHGLMVQPPRVVLSAHVGTANGTWENDELTWGVLPVLLVNDGGKGATELVVDIRYDGRIISTVNVNLVPALGNHTFTVSILPLFSKESVQVYLVEGPGAPSILGDMEFSVLPRPILDVVDIKVSPRSVESGQKVHIEAIVRNRGNATTTGQMVELMVDGSVVTNATIDGLEPRNETVVEADRVLTGEGTHSVTAIAEGDDFAAKPVAVEVKAASPSLGVWAVLLCLVLVSLAARRSRSTGRA
jgi:hypothetical protein